MKKWRALLFRIAIKHMFRTQKIESVDMARRGQMLPLHFPATRFHIMYMHVCLCAPRTDCMQLFPMDAPHCRAHSIATYNSVESFERYNLKENWFCATSEHVPRLHRNLKSHLDEING